MKTNTMILVTLVTVFALGLSGAVVAQGPQPAQVDNVAALPSTGNLHQLTAQQARNVTLVGQVGGIANAVVVQGIYAYLGIGPRLVILDVSEPALPTLIGQTAVLPNIVEDVAVVGSCAYLALNDSGLRIIDISSPASPIEVGYDPAAALDVAVVGSYAYVVNGEGLRVLDVSRPEAPAEAGFYTTPSYAWGVAVDGEVAYASTAEAGLLILEYKPPLLFHLPLVFRNY